MNKFFEKVKHYNSKLEEISKLQNLNELNISFDRLNSEENVNQELIYFSCDESCKCKEKERKGLFIFSQDYFFQELNDQEFKKILGKNMLNLLIKDAFNKVKNNNNEAKINEIIESIMNEFKSFKYISRNKILKRILTLMYYFNWDMKKVEEEIDSNYIISIPEDFGQRLKQRFNLEIMLEIQDNSKYLFFVNAKGDLCLVLKNNSSFSKDNLNPIFDMIKKEFNIKKINILN